MKGFGIIGLVALIGAGIALTTALNVRIGDIGSLDEHEWLGVGA